MKIKLDYTTKNLISDNLIYIVTFFVLISVLVIATSLFLKKYYLNNLKLSSIGKEIETFRKKKELLEFKSKVISNEIDLNQINGVLTQLIPSREDYFSIISTLENLSRQTNFLVTSYNIVLGDSTDSKLSILIEGQGDPNSFLEFLKTYNFEGGRLITIDKIEFSQEAFTGGKLNINFYTGKVTDSKKLSDFATIDTKLIEEVLNKVQVVLKVEDVHVVDYDTKSNPF